MIINIFSSLCGCKKKKHKGWFLFFISLYDFQCFCIINGWIRTWSTSEFSSFGLEPTHSVSLCPHPTKNPPTTVQIHRTLSVLIQTTVQPWINSHVTSVVVVVQLQKQRLRWELLEIKIKQATMCRMIIALQRCYVKVVNMLKTTQPLPFGRWVLFVGPKAPHQGRGAWDAYAPVTLGGVCCPWSPSVGTYGGGGSISDPLPLLLALEFWLFLGRLAFSSRSWNLVLGGVAGFWGSTLTINYITTATDEHIP